MAKKGRVAIVHPWSNFDTIPSLCNTALLLAQYGYTVDVYTHTNPVFNFPSFDNYDVNLKVIGADTIYTNPIQTSNSDVWRDNLRKLGIGFKVLKIIHRLLRIPLFLVRRGIGLVKRARDCLSVLQGQLGVLKLHYRSPYICFIGVDPEGLAEADILAKLIDVPLVYYSLELLLSSEVTGERLLKLKQREVALCQRASFVIIQDRKRAQLLAKDNKIPLSKCVLVPNSPLGKAKRAYSNFWHERFGLARDKRVVLHAGSLSAWTGIDEIVASVESWPSNWVLVVHARYDAESSGDVERLRKLSNPKRVFFSLKPVPRQDYSKLVEGADIGIAFYVLQEDSTYTQENIRTIGFSSGKIAFYLQSGLPTIVNDAVSISTFLERERCGFGVRGGSDVGKAIEKIAESYEEFSINACKAFNNYLRFEDSFQGVIKRIDNL